MKQIVFLSLGWETTEANLHPFHHRGSDASLPARKQTVDLLTR